MTTEQLPRDPVSSRGLASGGLGTPLRDIRGKLAGYRQEDRAIEGTTRKASSVMLQLADLEVFHSEEPYSFLTAEIRIPLSNSTNSRWGILADSANKIMSKDGDFPKTEVGKSIRLTVTPGHKLSSKNRETNKWEDIIVEAWEVTEIAGKTKGAASANPMDELKTLLDGKTKAEFNSQALAHPYVKNSPDAQRSILDNSFVEGLVTTGAFTVDANKVYHKVAK
jgi:hypothetical protein